MQTNGSLSIKIQTIRTISEEVENLNRWTTKKGIGKVIKDLSFKETQGPDGFTTELSNR